MADTLVSKTDVLADAVEQNARNAIHSRGVHYAAQKTTDTAVDTATGAVELNLVGVKSSSSGLTVSTTDITVPAGGAGVYQVNFSASVLGINGQNISVVLNIDDVSSGWIDNVLPVTADLNATLEIKAVVSLTATDVLNIVLDEAADGAFTITSWNLSIIRIDA